MNKKKVISLAALSIFMLPLSACGGSNEKSTILRVLNMEDYIYTYDPDLGYYEPDFIDQFAEYIASDSELSEKYGNVKVIYDTTDTNETLYSEMQTGKAHYDLICPSDYMIQKLIMYDLIEELDWDEVNDDVAIPNYVQYGSTEIRSRLNNITAKRFKDGQEVSLQKYAVGYMWGTLGILFNPNYNKFNKRHIDIDQVLFDMQDWSTLWDNKYSNTISVKDSMRDTYAVGLMHTYKEELEQLLNDYRAGTISSSEYNHLLNEIFNRCEKEQVAEVKESLMSLKDNVFGLEVDSGKQDIVTGKIGVNLAWSGDAVYSMDQAEDEAQVGSHIQTLTYSVPQTGSNIWFDAWVMPKTERSDLQRDLAHEFLNFMCDPIYASKNMDYTGYTPFIGGDSILELVRDWYDCRTDEIYEVYKDVYCSVFTSANPSSVDDAIGYDDLISSSHDTSLDSELLYFHFDEDENEEIDEGEILPLYIYDDAGEIDHQKTYGELTLVDNEVFDYDNIPADFAYDSEELCYEYIEKVDLTYFFTGTLDEYTSEDMVFYGRGNYLPYCYQDDNGDWHHNTSVGRQFFVQFPSEETMVRCAVMRDYGANNQYVMNMWEEFRSNSLPTWALILFVLEILLAAGGIAWWIYNKSIKKKLRQRRIESKEGK